MRFAGVVFVMAAVMIALFWAQADAQQRVIVKKSVVLQQEQEEQDPSDENGEKPDDGGEEYGPAKPDDKSSQVFMQDGTFIVGQIDLETFEIVTEYGKLVVPRDQIIKMRIGKNANKELKEKIESLISKLGDQEFKVREEATKELNAMGIVVLQELRDAAKSEDIEVKTRAEKLVKEIEASISPDAEEVIDDDEIVTRKFTIRGELLVENFVIETRYGTMRAAKKDVKAIVVSQPSGLRKTVIVSGTTHAGNNSMKDTGIDLKKGDRISISASGTVFIRNWGINVSPDGDQSYGQHFPNIPAGALMGKIGKSGTLFNVGSSYNATVEADGRLYLGIGVRDRYSNGGDFRVKIQIDKK